MKKFVMLTLAALFVASSIVSFSQTAADHQKAADKAKLVNTRVDNMGYWKKMAALGLARLNGVTPVKPAVYTGSEIKAYSVLTEDSPDVPTSVNSTTQSENSTFVDPDDNLVVLNSNNSTPNPVSNIYGSDALLSTDGSQTWGGTYQGAGGSNSGDPVALIGNDGAYYIGAISNASGQQVSKSTNGGASYQVVNVANATGGGLLDKNHMWVDNCPTSPYEGYLYDAWTDFGSLDPNNIGFSRSIDGGSTWSAQMDLSSAINAGSHNQGVNINSGPNGEVYAIWAVYDGWPTDESAIGFAKSTDGGATFQTAARIISNIRGIRTTEVAKDMRCNSFPSMAVDISNGEYSGNIYVVWTNIGVPGTNTGDDADVYIIRSEDQGATWSTPVKVNQDASGLGRKHYLPWITCDPENGILSTVFYDDRNLGGNQCEVYCANSYDAGVTWEDFKVSDVAFTPSPIPGLADGYMGDYLGINARGGWVYPTWADNRTGSVMTYCSPYETNPLSKPKDLTANVTFETGISDLHWSFSEAPLFSYFKIYRDNDSIGIAYDTIYNDQLPDYGIYHYLVTAKYSDGNESSGSSASVQWGDAQISVTPTFIEETLLPDSSVTRIVTISNIGQLDMNYNISMFIPVKAPEEPKAYCAADGSCDEYISRIQLNEIDNPTLCTNYGDYTAMSTTMSVGNIYQMTITNGNPIYPDDQAGVWVDWNQNEVFDDNEACQVSGSPGTGPYIATIAPPVGAMPGLTRIRARVVYYMTPPPCGSTTYGEVEDYSVYVQSWLTATPVVGTIPASQSMDIAVNLSAVDMGLGVYAAELQIYSNDPDDPEIIVPITLTITDFAVTLNTDDDQLCVGESTTINSSLVGGSGTYTYTWTSNPPGFSSSDPNVTVTPDVTTVYTCSVFDGSNTVNNDITITVNPLPTVDLGADASICAGESKTLDAGAGMASYLWSTGETTQTITVQNAAEYSVTVNNEFGCSASDAMTLTVNQAPEKPVITGGPATVDNYDQTSSTYTCGAAANAASYLWVVDPAGAGTTSSTTTSADVTWTAGYTGSVQITVQAQNDCFTGEVSDAFATTVYSSAGINDPNENLLIMYPNPTDGKITVKLPLQNDFTGDFTVTDAGAAEVFSKTSLTVPANNTVSLDLGQLSKGIYTVKFTSKSTTYTGRIIVK
jgi:hypothetical protein